MPYVDTSVVVAYYVPEPLSNLAQEFFLAHTALIFSDLTELEFYSTLSLRLRTGSLTREHVDRISQLFQEDIDGGVFRRIPPHTGHYRIAKGFIGRFDLPLKPPDALHLAVASVEKLDLVTADRQLARNAAALGIPVELLEEGALDPA